MIKRPESYLVGRRSAEGLVPSFTAKWTGEHVTLTGMREDYAPDAAERRALLGHFNVGSLWELSGGGAMNVDPAGKDLVKLLKARWKKSGASKPSTSSGPPTSKQSKANIEKLQNAARACENKDAAWDFWVAQADGDADTWLAAVEKIGKPEDDFEDSDWGEVAVQAVLPF